MLLRLDSTADSVALLLAASSGNRQIILAASHYNDGRLIELTESLDADCLVAPSEGTVRVVHRREQSAVNGAANVCLLTSGSTGPPKAVRHDWGSLTSGAKVRDRYRGTVWLLSYPLSHFAGMQVFLQCFVNGGRLVVPADATPTEGARAILTHKVEYLSCTPTYARQLFLTLPVDTWRSSALKQLTLGGEIVDQSTLDLIARCAPTARITHIYASSELGPVLEVRDGKAGFDRSSVDGKRLRIVDGELHVKRGTGAMIGYLGGATQDEWFATRDLVEVDGDRVKFIGRSDDVINVGGFKVTPSVVEQAIRRVDGVVEVVVVPQSSSVVGNLFKAVIQPAAGIDQAALRRAVVEQCKRELPDYMTPRLFAFVDEMKISESRKLRRVGH